MIRIRKNVASLLSALLVLGACGVASAQSSNPSQPSNKEPSTQSPSDKGGMTQEQLDHDKVMLKESVQDDINGADQQIDALKNMSKNDKGADKKRDDDYQKQISTLRDHLKADLDKIDKAKLADWAAVRPIVDRDLSAMDAQIQKVALVTKVPVPTGVANRQPSGTTGSTSKQPSDKSTPPPAPPPPPSNP